MKYSETVANRCRYGEVAEKIFGDCEIIWEHSMDDYQGFANVLAAKQDGSFIHYEWTYGSCSGCDEWEDRGLTDQQIENEMRSSMAVLKDRDTLKQYLKLEGEFEKAKVPTANTSDNGSIPGMLHFMFGVGEDFEAMGKAALLWLEANPKS